MNAINEIVKKFLNNQISENEEEVLKDWIKNPHNLETFKEKIRTYEQTNIKKFDSDIAYQKFLEKKAPEKSKVIKLNFFLKYVAVVVIFVFGFYLVDREIGESRKNIIVTSKEVKKTILKTDKIKLTLDDGSVKDLDNLEELSYISKKDSGAKTRFHRISIPKGNSAFKLVLSDGTIVWLNADTQFRFPEEFSETAKNRVVFLDGEAFFEVAHNNKQPFIVNTNGIDVKVLGTKFNVSSYQNDDFISTTLLEGSVKVMDSVNNSSLVLKPSFQASFQKKDAKFHSKKVNVLEYTAWMQNRIVFNDAPFEKLLSKIERKYNVEIVNNNERIKKIRFNGQFDIENIESILKALSTSYHFRYSISNNKVIIDK